MKKLTARILCAVLALTTVSCGTEAGKTDDTTTSAGSGETTVAPVDDPLADNLPAKNYNNEEFVIAAQSSTQHLAVTKEEKGEICNDSRYHRNRDIEERFGVKLEVVHADEKTLKTMLTNSIQSGEDEYDLVCYHVVHAGSLAREGLFNNWYDIDHIDFSRPWWAPSTTNDLSADGYCPLAIGDFAISALTNSFCVFFNHRLAKEYNTGDIYALVNDGKWTLDKARELTKDVYADVNKNSTVDDADQFGYVSSNASALNTYLWAFGGKVIDNTQDGLKLVYHTETTSDMVAELCAFFNENTDARIGADPWNWATLLFKDGRALFSNGLIGETQNTIRDMKDDYGIIPYPKWDEAQKEYATMVDGSHDILAVPITVKDTERVGIITEALCAESYKQVVPAYYEVALKTKYARDDESVKMLDKVVNSRVFDIGYVYDEWSGASFIFQALVRENNENFESYWATNSSAIEEHYAGVIEFFKSKGAK